MAFKSLLDPDFQYRSAANTNVRETFERIRREERLKDEQRRDEESEDARVSWLPEAHRPTVLLRRGT
ncbi:MAG TPA: hypothetical protein VMN03_09470 [Burkholderiales bacterium]|nr:hypothetical protein [Burkholderiales bacterium]